MFIGYSAQTKGYKLFNPQKNEVIISRDVEFNEAEAWDWQNVEKSQIGISLNEESVSGEPQHVAPLQNPTGIRISTRPRVLPACLHDYVMSNDNDVTDEELVNFALFTDCDPLSFTEAAQHDEWLQAMDAEIQSIEKK